MGFKTQPSYATVVTNFFSNIPRRVSGKPVIPAHSSDPEICSAVSQNLITNAFTYVANRIVDIDLMGGECPKLATCLAGKTISSIEITCAHCTGGKETSASSNTADSTIQLCLSNFGATLSQSTVNGLVLRELIRMCGGMELDAWGFYAYFEYVSHQPGATYYSTLPDYMKMFMCSGSTALTGGYRAGNFLVWYPSGGKLYPKVRSGTGWAPLTSYALITNTAGFMAWQYMC